MAPRLAGKTFVFGNIPGWKKNEYRRLIQHQGGAVVEKVTNQLDFLLFEGPQPSPPKARKVQRLNAQGAGIQCIDSRVHETVEPHRRAARRHHRNENPPDLAPRHGHVPRSQQRPCEGERQCEHGVAEPDERGVDG